jgi:hypothetical protein
MSATRLRLLLSAAVVLLAGLTVTSIWVSQRFLTDQVRQTDHAKIDADLQEQNLAKLTKLQEELKQQATIIERAKQIAAESTSYAYQDQVIADLTTYAAKSGVGVASIDFEQTKSAPQNKTSLTLILRSPVAYINFLNFIYQIEQNLTKLQVTSIALAPDPKDTNKLLNPSIKLEVFLKK